jgi:hypothetical protein
MPTIPAPFDANGWPELTDQLLEACSPQRFAQLPRSTNDSQLPVFIVAMPRSGSTLIETIIDAHPDAHGAGEFEATRFLIESIPLEIGSNLPSPACVEDIDQNDVDGLSRTCLDCLTAQNPDARRITDKYLVNYRHLGLLVAPFPAGRIIHCRRHPLDICLSCSAMVLMPHPHPFASHLRDLGVVYLDYERVMHRWRDVLGIPRLEVPHGALVADQESWSRRIIEFCGLDRDDRCLRFHEGARVVQTASYDQVTKPGYTSSVARYRGFEPHLGPLKEVLAGGWADRPSPGEHRPAGLVVPSLRGGP